MSATVYDNGVSMTPRYHAHMTLRLTPDDVGERVSVRRRLPEGAYSDTIGYLESWQDGVLSIRRRDGSIADIGEDTLVAGKVVPPPPPRRRPRTSPE